MIKQIDKNIEPSELKKLIKKGVVFSRIKVFNDFVEDSVVDGDLSCKEIEACLELGTLYQNIDWKETISFKNRIMCFFKDPTPLRF